MTFRKSAVCAVLMLLVVQTQTPASCGPLGPWEIDTTRYNPGNDPAIITTVRTVPPLSTVHAVFRDTLRTSVFLSLLKAAYDSSNLVVVAEVATAVKSFPEPKTLNQVVFAKESVTVQINAVLKGSIQHRQQNFIHTIVSLSKQMVYDSITGTNIIASRIIIPPDPEYTSLSGQRFLLFAQNEDQCFDIPLHNACNPYTYSYRINSDGDIFYDGFDIDIDHRTVNHIPNMTVHISDLTEYFKDVAVTRSEIWRPRITTSSGTISTYNLLGKRILRTPGTIQTKRKTAIMQIVEEPGKNGAVTKRITFTKR